MPRAAKAKAPSGGQPEEDGPKSPLANCSIEWGLAYEVDAFIAESDPPKFSSRNDFASFAVREALRTLRREEMLRLAMEAYKQGKPGPFDDLRRAGIEY